jgi:hypothetical protein
MRLRRHLLAALAAAALLSACSPAAPAEQPSATTAADATAPAAPTQAATNAYPGPSGAYPAPGSAYPGAAPAADLGPTVSAEPVVVPQPSSDQVGVVTGTLLRTADGGNAPLSEGYVIFLGNLLPNDQGVDGLVELDKITAPKAPVNALGQFVFEDVAPGRYGLMLELRSGTVLLNNPQDGGDLIVEVTGGQITDLGELGYPLPAE